MDKLDTITVCGRAFAYVDSRAAVQYLQHLEAAGRLLKAGPGLLWGWHWSASAYFMGRAQGGGFGG